MQYVEFLQGQKDVIYFTPSFSFFFNTIFHHITSLSTDLHKHFTNTSVTHSNSGCHTVHFQHKGTTRRHGGSFLAYYEEPCRNFADMSCQHSSSFTFQACEHRKLVPPQTLNALIHCSYSLYVPQAHLLSHLQISL